MSKTLLVVHASPRKKGNSVFLAHKAMEAAGKKGLDISEVYLQDLSIKPCSACYACRRGKAKYCAIKDDMQPLYEKVAAADAILLSSPIYWFTVSAQLKLFMDRLYGLYCVNGKVFKGKKIGVILTYGGEDPYDSGAVNAIRTLTDAFTFVGSEIAGIVYGTAEEIGDAKKNKVLIKKACDLGKQLANR
jgi:multimeric flavodoxin WrbA